MTSSPFRKSEKLGFRFGVAGKSVHCQPKGQARVGQGPQGFVLGRPKTSHLLYQRLKPDQGPRAACPWEDTQGHGVRENSAQAPHHSQLRKYTCVTRDLDSPAGIIIIWQEDVAYCQEQILLDTWVIVRD